MKDNNFLKAILLLSLLPFLLGAMEYRPVSPGQPFPYILGAVFTPLDGTGPHEAAAAGITSSVLEATYDRPYGMKELSASRLRFGIPAGMFSFHMAWNNFGIEQYRENSLSMGTGFRWGRYLRLGGRGAMYVIDVGEKDFRERQVAWDGGASLALSPFTWLSMAGALENIHALSTGGKGYVSGQWSCGISLVPRQGLHFTANVSYLPSGYVTTLTAGTNLLSFLSIEGGYSRETSSGSFSVTLLFRNIAAACSIRYHPHLGYSHSVSLQLRQKPARFIPLTYGRDPERERIPVTRIDIQECSLKELQGVPVLKSPFPERIIRYREIMGPLTEKSLQQLGLRGAEIARLYRYVKGIKRDRKFFKKQRKKTTYKVIQRRRKKCFAALIAAGVPSVEAMSAARGLPRSPLSGKIYAGLLPEEKKKVRRLCGSF